MASLNEVLLIGNMVRDPELKQTTAGKSVCNFSIAVNRPFAKEGQQDVDFVDIVTWEKQAEFVAKYFPKGEPIYVRGRLQQRLWTDNEGQKHYAIEILADDVSFVRSKDSASKKSE